MTVIDVQVFSSSHTGTPEPHTHAHTHTPIDAEPQKKKKKNSNVVLVQKTCEQSCHGTTARSESLCCDCWENVNSKLTSTTENLDIQLLFCLLRITVFNMI